MANKGLFLDSSVFLNKKETEQARFELKENVIRFEFPDGFTTIPLIEECRALQSLDVSVPENFDLMYDITMQMLSGKPVCIYATDGFDKQEVEKFYVTGRYMNLRGVPTIDAYPVLVVWLVEMVAEYLRKKFPRSLSDMQALKGGKEEPTKQ